MVSISPERDLLHSPQLIPFMALTLGQYHRGLLYTSPHACVLTLLGTVYTFNADVPEHGSTIHPLYVIVSGFKLKT
jgi:hypothetical protein